MKVTDKLHAYIMKKVLISSTPVIFKSKNFLVKNSLVIIPTSNNSRTNEKNDLKICIQAILAANVKIASSIFKVYIEKIKIR